MKGPDAMKVLHVAAEVYPLVKTGGLADVVAALPVALVDKGADVRLMLPGRHDMTGPPAGTTLTGAPVSAEPQ